MTNYARNLILHVGHNKTGSSVIQSALALSVNALSQAGILYPDHPSFAVARSGHVSTGNLGNRQLLPTFEEACRSNDECHTILFSNEGQMRHLLAEENPLMSLLGLGAKPRILLYIRDPLDHALSTYGQSIKRAGATGKPEAFLRTYTMPSQVLKLLQSLEHIGVPVSVLNYSRHAHRLIESFASLLGVADTCLNRPPHETVNRSLTRSELFLQSRFNAHWGQESFRFVSDPLCNELPEIKAESAHIPESAYVAFVERLTPILEAVNEYLPEEERYRVQPFDQLDQGGSARGEVTGGLVFSEKQIEVLVRSISERIPAPDHSLKYQQFAQQAKPGYQLSPSDVRLLMEIGLALSPWSETLRQKIKILSNTES